MLNSPIFSVSPHLSRWVVSQWVVSWWSQSPPAELPFTQSRIISAELLSWVSLCPINSAIIHNTFLSPSFVNLPLSLREHLGNNTTFTFSQTPVAVA